MLNKEDHMGNIKIVSREVISDVKMNNDGFFSNLGIRFDEE